MNGQQPRAVRPQVKRVVGLTWLGGLALIVALSIAAHGTAYFPIELNLTQGLQGLQSPTLDAVTLTIDWFGYVPQIFILVALCAVFLWAIGRRWEGALLLGALGTEGTIAQVVKLFVQRPRPADSGLVHAYHHHGDASYPSGHVFCYVVVFGLLIYYAYRYLPPAWWRTAAVLLVAFTLVAGVVRIYLGEHWLFDVLAGYLLGALALPLLIWVYEWGLRRWGDKSALLRASGRKPA